jgi:hypothetical protein
MSSGTQGLVSNYNDSGYTVSTGGDGMMLASVLSSNANGLILQNRNDTGGTARSGANNWYPNPGGAFSAPGGAIYSSGNYRYGQVPNSDSNGPFRRNQNFTVTGRDIYNFTNPGVFHLDNNNVPLAPIPSSIINTNSLFEITINTDNGYIVYPGWGFRLFNGSGNTWQNFTDQSWNFISYTYFNDTNEPIFFTCAFDWSSNNKVYGRDEEESQPHVQMQNSFISIPIMVQVRNNTNATNNSQNRSWADDATTGIQVFFRSGTPLYRFGLT